MRPSPSIGFVRAGRAVGGGRHCSFLVHRVDLVHLVEEDLGRDLDLAAVAARVFDGGRDRLALAQGVDQPLARCGIVDGLAVHGGDRVAILQPDLFEEVYSVVTRVYYLANLTSQTSRQRNHFNASRARLLWSTRSAWIEFVFK